MPSKKRPSHVVAGAGWTVQFMAAFMRAAEEAGLSDEEVHRLGTEDGVEYTAIGATAFVESVKKAMAEAANCRTIELTAQVDFSLDWAAAIEAAAPQTPKDFNVWQVGSLFRPTVITIGDKEYILRNFPKGGGSWEKAQAWAKSEGHKPTLPQEVFAIVEKHDLRQLTGQSWSYLVSTTDCDFEGVRWAVCVCVGGSLRGANLFRLDDFGGDRGWFLSRKGT